MKKLLLLALLPLTAMATPIKGFFENYQDWDLICDNTGTCNMVGYQNGLVSLLFRREPSVVLFSNSINCLTEIGSLIL